MIRPRPLFVIAALALTLGPARAAADDFSIDPDRYGAIAFSPKTGKYGYAWDQSSRASAERVALAECKADDKRVLTWVRFGWAALVITEDNAYGYYEVHGDGSNSRDAYQGALKNLRQHSDAEVKTIVIICSGDVRPKVITK